MQVTANETVHLFHNPVIIHWHMVLRDWQSTKMRGSNSYSAHACTFERGGLKEEADQRHAVRSASLCSAARAVLNAIFQLLRHLDSTKYANYFVSSDSISCAFRVCAWASPHSSSTKGMLEYCYTCNIWASRNTSRNAAQATKQP